MGKLNLNWQRIPHRKNMRAAWYGDALASVELDGDGVEIFIFDTAGHTLGQSLVRPCSIERGMDVAEEMLIVDRKLRKLRKK